MARLSICIALIIVAFYSEVSARRCCRGMRRMRRCNPCGGMGMMAMQAPMMMQQAPMIMQQPQMIMQAPMMRAPTRIMSSPCVSAAPIVSAGCGGFSSMGAQTIPMSSYGGIQGVSSMDMGYGAHPTIGMTQHMPIGGIQSIGGIQGIQSIGGIQGIQSIGGIQGIETIGGIQDTISTIGGIQGIHSMDNIGLSQTRSISGLEHNFEKMDSTQMRHEVPEARLIGDGEHREEYKKNQ